MNTKQASLPALLSIPMLRIGICALLMTSAQNLFAREPDSSNAIFATGAADGGRLVIKRSPVMADNAAITIMIDGKPAGTLSRNRGYDRYIAPGRHSLTASPNRSGDAWHGTLNVRVGETYSYTASYNVSKVVLTPAKMSH
jgi:hypothetical protein